MKALFRVVLFYSVTSRACRRFPFSLMKTVLGKSALFGVPFSFKKLHRAHINSFYNNIVGGGYASVFVEVSGNQLVAEKHKVIHIVTFNQNIVDRADHTISVNVAANELGRRFFGRIVAVERVVGKHDRRGKRRHREESQ